MPAERVYLYVRQGSPGCLIARVGLELKDLAWREADVPAGGPEREAYLLMSPTGILPCLEVEGTVVAGAAALLEYLDERHPRPPLMPRDPDLRAHVRQAMHAIGNLLAPLDDAASTARGLAEFAGSETALARIDRLLEREAGNYAAGRSLSLADPFVHALAQTATKAGLDIAPFATIATVARHISLLTGFARARL